MKITLHGATLEELETRVSEEYGHKARIIEAVLVTVGGIGGFLARKHYEVTVGIADSLEPGSTAGPPKVAERPEALRSGLAALLADADEAEARIRGSKPDVIVSTSSQAFSELIDGLVTNTGAPQSEVHRFAPVQTVPYPSVRPGDLTLVAGLGDDPLEAALSIFRYIAGEDDTAKGIYTAGMLSHELFRHVGDRLSVTAARAAGVESGLPIVIAYGLGRGEAANRHAELVRAIGADQVWVAVDAGRKPEDTRLWFSALGQAVEIKGVAVEGADATATPETVNDLAAPIGWLRGEPAHRPRI